MDIGQLRRSRFLCYYSVFVNFLGLCIHFFSIYSTYEYNHIHDIPSNFIPLFSFINSYQFLGLFFIYVDLVQFHQIEIVKLYREVQKILKYFANCNYKKLEKLYLWRDVSIAILNAITMVIWDGTVHFKFFRVHKLWYSVIGNAAYIFGICMLWNIRRCFCYVLSWLEDLEHRCLEYKELRRLQRIHQQLINATKTFSSIYSHIIFFFLMRTSYFCMISLYFTIRIYYSNPRMHVGLKYQLLTPLLCINGMILLFTLGSATGRMEKFSKETKDILRRSCTQHELLERSNSLLGLHLSLERTDVRLYGQVTINRRLCFTFLSQILLYVICMIQEDFNIIWH
ncbi:uncharacterized protein LOC132791257 [Drosophila nasuta]|uniref:uncharacterized protein LOC132791257 n=1 Tax=Drosophila nasuta TaxID=42062 RepID=UPI00295E5D70|nr:uncharacterized protein LOC132791257 [Drosophila nasuta]